jgi:hypothetical protein
MYIKKAELKIDSVDPFSSDKLKRRESAEILTQLLSFIEEPFVLSINSPWGTGKTTFVKMWEQHLKSQGFECLYFNAWESDFHTDPLIPLIGEIQAEIISQLDEGKSKAKEYFDKARRIGGTLARRAVPAAAKIATAGVLDLNDFTEAAISDLIAQEAKRKIDSYETTKQTIREFKRNLEGFAKELKKFTGKPVVFFIDELDRCRPPYAIELLERAKHLFSVPGIIFVLVIDKDQICNSIKAQYSPDMSVDGYLRRFIDLEYQMPQASIKDFCDYVFEQTRLKEFLRQRNDHHQEETVELLGALQSLSETFNLSLRVIEQCFTQLNLALLTTPNDSIIFPSFLAFLIVLKAANRKLYNQFIKGETSPQQVLDFITEQPKGSDFLNDDYGLRLEAYIVSAHCAFDDYARLIADYTAKAKDEKLSSELQVRFDFLARTLENFRVKRYTKPVNYLAKKIEISERFTQSGEAAS